MKKYLPYLVIIVLLLVIKLPTQQVEGAVGQFVGYPGVFYADTILNTFGLGTSTPQFLLQIATGTAPQLVLSDASSTAALTVNDWAFRSVGGFLYIATSSPTTLATSTRPAITITPNGGVSFGSSTPTISGAYTFGASSIGASTTDSMGKWQVDFYNAAGTRSCAFVVGTAWVIVNTPCRP